VSALNFLFNEGEINSAIPLIIENFQKLFNDGRFECLWRWLNSIDKDTALRNPYLVYYTGILYKFFAGDLESSLEYLQRAIDSFRELNDSNSLIACYLNKASVLLNLGRIHETIGELTDLLKEQASQENKAKLLYFMAYAYYQNSQYEMAVNLSDQSLEMCTDRCTDEIKRNNYILLGHINLIKGEYMRSIKSYEQSLDLNPNVLDKFELKCNLVLMHSQSGNSIKAKEFLDKLRDMMNDFPSPFLKIPYLLAKQAYLFECGKYEENIIVLKEIHSIASSMHHKYYTYLSYRLLSDTYYHMNDLEKAQVYYEYACSSVDESNELEKMELAVVKALLRKKVELDPSIEFIFMLAYDYFKTQNLEYSKAQVCFHLADFYFKAGNFPESMKYFEECLRISREKDYISHLYRELSHSEELFEHALGNKIQEEFINKLKVSMMEMVQD
jgi:tetratricopeptide (TPR) repeat protein